VVEWEKLIIIQNYPEIPENSSVPVFYSKTSTIYKITKILETPKIRENYKSLEVKLLKIRKNLCQIIMSLVEKKNKKWIVPFKWRFHGFI
jgi:hypothetical protein